MKSSVITFPGSNCDRDMDVALKKFGFENVTVVSEQSQPNGDFPTVIYPNPEEAEALEIALKTAKNINADLVLATDPDADRVGIAAKNTNHELELLNGNQTAVLLIYYLLRKLENEGVDQVILLTGYLSEKFEKFLSKYSNDFKLKIETAYLDEKYETYQRIKNIEN